MPLPDSVDGDRRTQTTRWAKNHMRRNNLALGLSKDRPRIAGVKTLLYVIYLDNLRKRDPVYIALHACLALGRSLHQLEGFEIHRGSISGEIDPDRIHYFWGSEQWVLPSLAPAWADLPTEPIERPRLPQITLPDCTGFSKLLKDIYLLRNDSRPDASIRLFQKLSKDGQAWVQHMLTGVLSSDDATPAQCASFLFHRLLEVTRGDLGIASLITGRDHSHSSSVRHYANYPAAQLWAAYRDTWQAQPAPSHVDVPPASVEPVVADNSYRQGYGYGAKRVLHRKPFEISSRCSPAHRVTLPIHRECAITPTPPTPWSAWSSDWRCARSSTPC